MPFTYMHVYYYIPKLHKQTASMLDKVTSIVLEEALKTHNFDLQQKALWYL
jgi:hypothetical protein